MLIVLVWEDFCFSAVSAREMASLVTSASLKIYPGKGHEILKYKHFAQDLAEFISAHLVSASQTE